VFKTTTTTKTYKTKEVLLKLNFKKTQKATTTTTKKLIKQKKLKVKLLKKT
jgi:hypothetical protein